MKKIIPALVATVLAASASIPGMPALPKPFRLDGTSRREKVQQLHRQTGWQHSVCGRLIDKLAPSEIALLVESWEARGRPKEPAPVVEIPPVDTSNDVRPAVLGGECSRCFHQPPMHEPTCAVVARWQEIRALVTR